jgi:Transcriptional regulators
LRVDKKHATTVPLHRQIAQSIYDDIMQRQLAAHTKIPSEVALAQQYGVSHGTITKALESLVHAHILYRQRPRGTFVAERNTVPTPPAQNIATNNASTLTDQKIKTERIETPISATPEGTVTAQDTASRTQLLAAMPSAPQATKNMLIGIIIPTLESAFIGKILTSVEAITRAAGYGIIFANSESDIAMEHYQVEQFLKQEIAGIIIFSGEHQVEERNGQLVSAPGGQPRIDYLRALQLQNIPFVLIDRYVPEIDCSYVVSDDYAAGYAATQHLISLGHRRIGFATAPYYLTSSYYRYIGYYHCLLDYKIPFEETLVLRSIQYLHIAMGPIQPHTFTETPYSLHDREQINAYLQRPERPTAIVAMNDLVAFHILQATEKLGISIPAQLALVCSGESSIGAYVNVPFTSIIQPVEEIGRQCTTQLLNLIAGRITTSKKIVLPVNLIVRQSSGGIPNNVPQFIPRHSYP